MCVLCISELRTEFRGRPFRGAPLELADGYKGIIAETSLNTSQDDGSLFIRKEFSNLTYWNWDKTPSGMDTPVKLMDWLELANVVSIL